MWWWIPRHDHFIPQTLSGPIQVIHLWANWQEMTLSARSDDKLVRTSCILTTITFSKPFFFFCSLLLCLLCTGQISKYKDILKMTNCSRSQAKGSLDTEKGQSTQHHKTTFGTRWKAHVDGTWQRIREFAPFFFFKALPLSPPHAEHKWHLGCCGL